MNFLRKISALVFVSLLSLNQLFAQEEYVQEVSIYTIGRYGKKMSNGDYLSSRHRTCSHEFLPMGSLIQITNPINNRSEVVEVNGKSQTTTVELTHSVAHDLGLTGGNKPTVKVFVVRRTEENITYSSTPLTPEQSSAANSKRITYGSQTSVETIPVFTNPEIEKVEAKKKKYEFSMDFPQHEPIKFDSTTKKVLINGKPIVTEKEKPVFKEKIIMN
jgi:rare lipoprotein A